MQLRGLLIAAAVLALLGGGVYWSNKSKEAEKDQLPKDAPPKVLTIQESEINQLEFRKKGMPATIVKRQAEGKWSIAEPSELAADSDSIASVTGVLANFNSETVSGTPPAGLEVFGLKDPFFTLNIVKKDGKQVAVLMGETVPVSGSVFVKMSNDPRVFTVSSSNRMALDKTWRDLRDKRLLAIDNDKLSRVELVANGKSIEFGKNQSSEWQIVKPNAYRADNWGIEELVRKLKDAKIDPASPDADVEKAGAAFAAAAPVAVAKLTDATGTQQIEIRKGKDKDPVYYAKSSSVAGIWKVQADLATAASKPFSDFRNKKIFDFGFNDPSKVDIKLTGQSKSCGKNGEKWICDGKEVKPQSVSALIDKLRDLSAKQFVENPSKPVPGDLDVTVTSADGKKNETVHISGNLAARGDELAIYELDPANVEGLKQAVAAIKEPEKTPPPSDAKKK